MIAPLTPLPRSNRPWCRCGKPAVLGSYNCEWNCDRPVQSRKGTWGRGH